MTGYIFKSIRADDKDYWDKFAAELVEPEKPENRFEKRMEGDRLPFTIRLNPTTNQYEVVETQKLATTKRRQHPLYEKSKKDKVTKHQSVSYANPANGFKPPVFGWNRAERQELLVGVSFNPKDCLFWLMTLYDGGTYGRIKDFRTREEAQVCLDEVIKKEIYSTSLEKLEELGKKNPDKYNEILAGLQWNLDGTSAITVFSDNLESRLLAQLRALDLQKRLEKKYPEKKPITVPILIYPDFKPYTLDLDEQQNDIAAAKADPNVLHYAGAIGFMHIEKIPENTSPDCFFKTYILLEKLRKEYAEIYFEKFTVGTNAGKNGFYCLMAALNEAAFKNSPEHVEKITTIISKLIEKGDPAALMAGLSEKDHVGRNGFYWLAVALNEVAFKNSPEHVKKITTIISKLIEKSDLTALMAGLSGKDHVGRNGFYCLMAALSNATAEDPSQNVEKIAALISELIEKSDSNPAALMTALSEKDHVGRNGFYWLAVALNEVAFKNSPEHVKKITTIISKLIEKSDLTALMAGLSEKDHVGRNGFYFLMRTLNDAAVKNSLQNVEKIAGVISKLIEKSNPTALTELIEGLSEKSTTGDHAGKNGFYWLIGALDHSTYFLLTSAKKTIFAQQEKVLAFLILSMLIKLNDQPLSTEIKNSILELKDKLREPLKKYLSAINDGQVLRKISEKNTLLGALIDKNVNRVHGFFRKKETKTATRTLVDARIAELEKKEASTVSSPSVGSVK